MIDVYDDQQRQELSRQFANRAKTPHQQRIEAFMQLAQQNLPIEPEVPTEQVRLLRAKLIFEEAMETINALGVQISFEIPAEIVERESYDTSFGINDPQEPDPKKQLLPHSYAVVAEGNMVEIVDGCCDISVVTIGTLSACGVSDDAVLRLVDESNLSKFGPGHSIREDGKLVKPPDFVAPDFAAALRAQGWLE